MNSTKQFLAWLVVLTCLGALTGTATTPKLQESVRINSLELIGDPTTGANVELKVTYTSHVNAEAILVLSFSGLIKPSDARAGETRRDEAITLVAGQTIERRFALTVTEPGASHISVGITLKEPIARYTRAHARYLNIESTAETFQIFDDVGSTPPAVKTITPHFGDDNPAKGEGPLGVATLYTVSISGKIEFDDANEFPVRRKGLYQNTVQLWFRNTANPNTWYHPVYSPDCYGTQHTHYDILDVNGNYGFNFSFNGDLSGYNQVLVIVSRDNPAIRMPMEPDGILRYCNPLPTVWFSLSQAVQEPINGANPNITLTNANRLVNPDDGPIFRNMMFAREFAVQRYQGNPPFSMPQIYVQRLDIPGNIAGQFFSSGSGTIPRIEIDNFATELTTTTHEFGHYVNYKMWNDAIPGSQELIEGWAVFYSMGAKNYANTTYSDDLRYWDDEGEVSPFTTSPRYAYIRYTYTNPGISAFACYLWNLYDDYYNTPLESFFYNGDNDDISGQEMNVFETYRTNSIFIYDPATYHAFFKTYLPSDVAQSVDKVYEFMQNPSSLMRPVQLSNVGLSTISPQQIQFGWATHHYNVGSDPFLQPGTNPPDQYRLYKSESGTWNLVQTAPFGSASATVSSSDPRGEYRITAHNASGDSYNSPVVTVLGMTLAAAQYIEPGSGGTYEVNGVPVGSSWLGYALQGQQMTLEAVPPSGAWHFLQWSDGNGTNPRSLSPTDHTSIHAIFKKHLSTTSTQAVTTNNQRKIAYAFGKYHIAYESAGEIWYTSSTDNGTTWIGDVLVSDGTGQNRNPSIAAAAEWNGTSWINYVGVAWEKRTTYGSDYASEVCYRRYNNSTGSWFASQSIMVAYGSATDFEDATPSLTMNGSYRTITWVVPDGFSNAGGLYLWVYDVGAGQDKGIVQVPGTNTSSRYPSTAKYTYDVSNSIGLAWAQNDVDAIKYSFVTLSTTPITFSASEDVSYNSGLYLHNYPSLEFEIASPYRAVVAWQAFDDIYTTSTRVVQRRRETGGWGVFTEYPGGDYYQREIEVKPSITRAGGSNLALTWHIGTSISVANYYQGGWGSRVILSSGGVNPSLGIDNESPHNRLRLIYANQSTSPYSIVTTSDGLAKFKKVELSNGEMVSRRVSMRVGALEYTATLKSLKMRRLRESEPLEFESLEDSVIVASEVQARDFLRLRSIEVPVNGRLAVDITLATTLRDSTINPANEQIVIRLQVFDATTDLLLGSVNLDTLSSRALGVRDLHYDLNLSHLNGRTVRIKCRPAFLHYSEVSWAATVLHEDSILAVQKNATELSLEYPASYTLHQNFPNPFNPITQLNFDLPEPGYVSLVVYDVLGRRVAELAIGYHEAGYHSKMWNAADEASGVYFARFVVTGSGGEVKYSKVNKLVLMK